MMQKWTNEDYFIVILLCISGELGLIAMMLANINANLGIISDVATFVAKELLGVQ